jgi:hypothetical protein
MSNPIVTVRGGFIAVRKSVGIAGVLVAILASFAVAPAAWAGNFYLYQNTGFGGHQATFAGSDYELNNKYWDGTTSIMQNGASSMINNRNGSVGMWDIGSSCTGANYVAKALSNDSTFSNNGFNDKASCVIFL